MNSIEVFRVVSKYSHLSIPSTFFHVTKLKLQFYKNNSIYIVILILRLKDYFFSERIKHENKRTEKKKEEIENPLKIEYKINISIYKINSNKTKHYTIFNRIEKILIYEENSNYIVFFKIDSKIDSNSESACNTTGNTIIYQKKQYWMTATMWLTQ